jgi:hypothetical protein
MAADFDKLFGSTLLGQSGAIIPTVQALSGKKYVMLYFSAHWYIDGL